MVAFAAARVGSCHYFATEHLWNARHLARLCQEREDVTGKHHRRLGVVVLSTATDMWALRYPEPNELYLLDRRKPESSPHFDLRSARIHQWQGDHVAMLDPAPAW